MPIHQFKASNDCLWDLFNFYLYVHYFQYLHQLGQKLNFRIRYFSHFRSLVNQHAQQYSIRFSVIFQVKGKVHITMNYAHWKKTIYSRDSILDHLNSQTLQYLNTRVRFNTWQISSTRTPTHVVANKGFLPAATRPPLISSKICGRWWVKDASWTRSVHWHHYCDVWTGSQS